MKVRKGDVVHILRGKDAGKEGRVLEALPKQGRVVVENINVVKRHRRPQPIQNATGFGGSGMSPGGIVELAAPLPVSNVMVVCPRNKIGGRGGGGGPPRGRTQAWWSWARCPKSRPESGRSRRWSRTGMSASASASSAVRRSTGHERRSRHVHPAPEGAVRE